MTEILATGASSTPMVPGAAERLANHREKARPIGLWGYDRERTAALMFEQKSTIGAACAGLIATPRMAPRPAVKIHWGSAP